MTIGLSVEKVYEVQHFTVTSSRKLSSIAYNRCASFGPPDSLSFLQIPLTLGFVR